MQTSIIVNGIDSIFLVESSTILYIKEKDSFKVIHP